MAVAGDNQTIVFPKTTVTLDGRGSSDDYRITSFHWSQLRYSASHPHTLTPSHPHTSHPPHSGPMDVSLSGVDTPVLEVSELHIDETVGSPTVYQFKLSVVDYRNTTNSTTVFVEFHKGETKLDAISLPPPPSHPHTLTPSQTPRCPRGRTLVPTSPSLSLKTPCWSTVQPVLTTLVSTSTSGASPATVLLLGWVWLVGVA